MTLNEKMAMHLKLIFTTSVMAFQQFLAGTVFGYSAVILPQLQKPDSLIHPDAEQASWIASIPLLVCPIGSLVLGYFSDRIGRKNSLQLTYIPMIASWTLLSNAKCLEHIYIGRLLGGLATGTGGVIFVYIAETSPTGSRPFYLMIITLFVSLGQLTTAALGVVLHWRGVAAVFGVLSAAGVCAPFLVPAPPMWLRSRGRHEEARKAERWFGFELPRDENVPPLPPPPPPPESAAVATLARGETTVDEAPGRRPNVGCWAAYTSPTVWKPAAAAFAFFVCQECTGFYMLLFYSVDVIRDCRVSIDGMTAAVYLGMARLTGTVASMVFQGVPKRRLTVVSSLGMCASMATVVGYLYAFRGSASPPAGDLLIVPFLLYVFFAMFAVLPLPWSVCGEMFPMEVKGTMNGVLYSCGYELMFAAIKIYPWLVATFGILTVWTACAVSCFVTALFGAFVLPETTGKSLNEIVDGFKSSGKCRKPLKIQLP
ncbi:facilitated trehalose transporter Tret1-like [Sipha flava]|uniref:Facilitated trehalose transporter Tret1-like n=1 Tax=Sipha flava TaxID=143950 RepID=A0A8B8F660_9HEMI|nr:facilitated trehalose transporter Tret1-like [Sipha flava]